MLTKTFAKDSHEGLTRATGLQAFNYLQSGSVKD